MFRKKEKEREKDKDKERGVSESSDKEERSEYWHLIFLAIFKLLPDKNTEKREKKSRERQRSEAKNSFMADHDLR